MSEIIEEEGNTVDEAVQEALDRLGVEASQVKVEVLREPSKGFLGIGGEKALVRVTVSDGIIRDIVGLVQDVVGTLSLKADVKVEQEEDHILLSVEGDAGLGILIGKHGETLNSLQTIVNAVLRRHGGATRVIVDVESYRKRRVDRLEKVAKRAADKATATGRAVSLGPMNSYERRIVHVTLKDNPEVMTESEGEEPEREVIVVPR